MLTLKDVRLSTAGCRGDALIDAHVEIAGKAVSCDVSAGSCKRDSPGFEIYCLGVAIPIDAIAGNDELLEESIEVRKFMEERD